MCGKQNWKTNKNRKSWKIIHQKEKQLLTVAILVEKFILVSRKLIIDWLLVIDRLLLIGIYIGWDGTCGVLFISLQFNNEIFIFDEEEENEFALIWLDSFRERFLLANREKYLSLIGLFLEIIEYYWLIFHRKVTRVRMCIFIW